jgi:hypothetical protein
LLDLWGAITITCLPAPSAGHVDAHISIGALGLLVSLLVLGATIVRGSHVGPRVKSPR